MMRRALVMMIVGWLVWTSHAGAADLYVGDQPGQFPTIQAAINAAQPGDTIHLDPAASPYREMAMFRNKFGEPGKPIVLDGHGAELLGSEPVNPKEWEDLGEGLWRSTQLAARLNMSRPKIGRFFAVFAGRPEYMGGANKHRRPDVAAPEQLLPGQWSYNEQDQVFHVRIEPGIPIEQAKIEWPVRSAGVALAGENAHLVVRNVTARHVWNDGFNIHGKCTDVRFENITAIECGDDGISAHGETRIVVDGFVSRGNSNGICHINQSVSENRNVHISDSRAYDLYLLDESRHTFDNLTVYASGARGTVLTRQTRVRMESVWFIGGDTPSVFRVDRGADWSVRQGTFWNAHMQVQQASAQLVRCVVAGPQATFKLTEPTGWESRENVWDVQRFVSGTQRLAGDDLTGWMEHTGQDQQSRIEPITLEQVIKRMAGGDDRGSD